MTKNSENPAPLAILSLANQAGPACHINCQVLIH